jgi:1-acyl-sn-glycerol-3-phosphate acyltransferase
MMKTTPNALRRPLGLIIGIFQATATLCVMLLLKIRVRVHVRYAVTERIKSNQRYVLAANHQNRSDPFVIFDSFPLHEKPRLAPIKFMAAASYYYSWLRPIMFLLGCFPAHNRGGPRTTYGVDGAVRLLSRGYNICIFPEGKRAQQGEQQAHGGVSRILMSYPSAKLLLAHIDWRRRNNWAWDVRIAIGEARAGLDTSDPQAILNAIYKL